MKLCSMLYGSLDGRGSLRKNGYMYMYGSSPETITTLLISYTSIQNKSFKVLGKKNLTTLYVAIGMYLEARNRQKQMEWVCPQKKWSQSSCAQVSTPSNGRAAWSMVYKCDWKSGCCEDLDSKGIVQRTWLSHALSGDAGTAGLRTKLAVAR